MTPSRFDRFLEGDKKALSSDEKKGLDLVIAKRVHCLPSWTSYGWRQFSKVLLQ